MNRIAVVGGFTEGRRALEPVAEAACKLGLARDADVFLFRNVIEDNTRLRWAARGQIVLTHSAGILAVDQTTYANRLIAYNGPEKAGILGLAGAALVKTLGHQKGMITGPDRKGHLRALASNTAELIAYPYANMRHLGRIAAFSTVDTLLRMQSGTSTQIESVVMDQDEFFTLDDGQVAEARQLGLSVTKLAGYHDDLLVDPHRVLSQAHLEV